MKHKLGFTLVELLAVIVILAIILSLAIPTIIGIINKSKDNAYNTQVDNIISATKFYIADNGSNISALSTVGGAYYVSLSELNTNGYLELPITNPKTGTTFDGDNNWVLVTKATARSYTFLFQQSKMQLDQ